ncbi:hypothetical protein [Sphingomonas sp. TREG-RG-20F-R18-01]|uniref:hypothetical protein n=1 Tax=Sphingomonas sp. TREG-RG-20F-R18-01 TaxID=2914982 RepID=UPI001F589BFA|nr:hypothetical protein [Sphingomonas sp. TREG-RG-20F-R18-01]
MLLLILAAQVATSAPVAPLSAPSSAPSKPAWSILEPVGTEPCKPHDGATAKPDDIIVCGNPLPSQALPYPNEVVLDRPKPSNPYMTGAGALAVEDSAPCATMQHGCGGGVQFFTGGTQVVRLVQKLVSPGSCCEDPGEATDPMRLGKDIAHGIGGVFRKKPDKSGRVPIALEDEPRPSVILP